MISFTPIFIKLANSVTVTNSVTLIIFFSASCISKSMSFCSLAATLFSFLYFDPLLFPPPVNLAKVSFI